LKLTLQYRSWHSRLWHYVYESEPPTNLCPYFWGLIASVILAPFAFLYYHWPKTDLKFPQFEVPEPGYRFGLVIMVSVMLAFFLYGILEGWRTPLALLGIAGMLFGGIYLVSFIVDRYSAMKPKNTALAKGKVKAKVEKNPSMTWLWLKSFKTKACPCIDWGYEK